MEEMKAIPTKRKSKESKAIQTKSGGLSKQTKGIKLKLK